MDSSGSTIDPLATLVQATLQDVSDTEGEQPGPSHTDIVQVNVVQLPPNHDQSPPPPPLSSSQSPPPHPPVPATTPAPVPPMDPETARILVSNLAAAERHNEKLELQLSSARLKISQLESQAATGMKPEKDLHSPMFTHFYGFRSWKLYC